MNATDLLLKMIEAQVDIPGPEAWEAMKDFAEKAKAEREKYAWLRTY